MDVVDTIWVALVILMTVCVYVDSGITVFSGIQVFELLEIFLFIAFPKWPVLSKVLAINLFLGLIGIFFMKRYPLARIVLAFDLIFMAIIVWYKLDSGTVVWTEHYINQAVILVLLFESVLSFFFPRSIYARRNAEARSKPTPKTTTTSPQRQLAFVRGLY